MLCACPKGLGYIFELKHPALRSADIFPPNYAGSTITGYPRHVNGLTTALSSIKSNLRRIVHILKALLLH